MERAKRARTSLPANEGGVLAERWHTADHLRIFIIAANGPRCKFLGEEGLGKRPGTGAWKAILPSRSAEEHESDGGQGTVDGRDY